MMSPMIVSFDLVAQANVSFFQFEATYPLHSLLKLDAPGHAAESSNVSGLK